MSSRTPPSPEAGGGESSLFRPQQPSLIQPVAPLRGHTSPAQPRPGLSVRRDESRRADTSPPTSPSAAVRKKRPAELKVDKNSRPATPGTPDRPASPLLSPTLSPTSPKSPFAMSTSARSPAQQLMAGAASPLGGSALGKTFMAKSGVQADTTPSKPWFNPDTPASPSASPRSAAGPKYGSPRAVGFAVETPSSAKFKLPGSPKFRSMKSMKSQKSVPAESVKSLPASIRRKDDAARSQSPGTWADSDGSSGDKPPVGPNMQALAELTGALERIEEKEEDDGLGPLVSAVAGAAQRACGIGGQFGKAVGEVLGTHTAWDGAGFGDDGLGADTKAAARIAWKLRQELRLIAAFASAQEHSGSLYSDSDDGSRSEDLAHALAPFPPLRARGDFGPARTAAYAVYFDDPSQIQPQINRLLEAFKIFDLDGSGYVTTEEVGAVLHSLGCVCDLVQVNEEVSAMATEEGTLRLDQFISFTVMNSHTLNLVQKKGLTARIEDVLREHTDFGTHKSQLFTESQSKGLERMVNTSRKLKLWLPDSRARRRWDLFVLGCLFISFSLIPHNVVVYSVPPTHHPVMLVLDLVIQFVFLADIVVFLNTCKTSDNGRIIASRWAIALRNWKMLLIDFIASLPFDFIALGVNAPIYVYVFFRSLRLLKGVKVKTLFQKSNRLPMNAQYVKFYFHKLPIVMFLFHVFLCLHYMVLVKMKISECDNRHFREDDGWSFNGREEQRPCPPRDLHFTASYVAAAWWWEMYWVVTVISTAPALLPLNNTVEVIYASLLMCVGVILQGIVVGKMSVLVLKESVQQQAADKMRGTLQIVVHYQLPADLQQEILSFQSHTLQQSAQSFAERLMSLPDSMQREIEIYMKMEAIASVKMFRGTGHRCKIHLVTSLRPFLAAPEEYIITAGEEGREMFFLVHGYADVIIPVPGRPIVATLTSGDSFGEIALLSADCKRTAFIRALTYCDLLRLEKDDFDDILQEFAEFRAIIHMEMKNRGISDEQRKRLFHEKGVGMKRANAKEVLRLGGAAGGFTKPEKESGVLCSAESNNPAPPPAASEKASQKSGGAGGGSGDAASGGSSTPSDPPRSPPPDDGAGGGGGAPAPPAAKPATPAEEPQKPLLSPTLAPVLESVGGPAPPAPLVTRRKLPARRRASQPRRRRNSAPESSPTASACRASFASFAGEGASPAPYGHDDADEVRQLVEKTAYRRHDAPRLSRAGGLKSAQTYGNLKSALRAGGTAPSTCHTAGSSVEARERGSARDTDSTKSAHSNASSRTTGSTRSTGSRSHVSSGDGVDAERLQELIELLRTLELRHQHPELRLHPHSASSTLDSIDMLIDPAASLSHQLSRNAAAEPPAAPTAPQFPGELVDAAAVLGQVDAIQQRVRRWRQAAGEGLESLVMAAAWQGNSSSLLWQQRRAQAEMRRQLQKGRGRISLQSTMSHANYRTNALIGALRGTAPQYAPSMRSAHQASHHSGQHPQKGQSWFVKPGAAAQPSAAQRQVGWFNRPAGQAAPALGGFGGGGSPATAPQQPATLGGFGAAAPGRRVSKQNQPNKWFIAGQAAAGGRAAGGGRGAAGGWGFGAK